MAWRNSWENSILVKLLAGQAKKKKKKKKICQITLNLDSLLKYNKI